MGNSIWPEWMPRPQDAPPPDPMVAREDKIANDTRVEQALNRFLAAKQGALFDAPDAFYRAQGEDAIHAAPVVTKNLDQLRSDLVDGLGNDYQRNRLGNALDLQMQLTRDGMARHVAEQSLAWQRGIAQDRIALLTKEAARHHNDTDLVDTLGHAAASAARAHARVGDGPPGGEAEDAAAATARSGVLGAAIQARLDRGDTQGANALLTQVQDQLDPAYAAPLQGQIATARRFDAARQYADRIEPPTSLDEIEAQRAAAMSKAAMDHSDDPSQQILASHFVGTRFDDRRSRLQEERSALAQGVHDWVLEPGPDGRFRTDPPPPLLWNQLNMDERKVVLAQLQKPADERQLAAGKPVVPPPPQIDPKNQGRIVPPKFKPIVIIPWELQRPEIDFDFEKTPVDEPPEDDRPSPPQGLPDENIG